MPVCLIYIKCLFDALLSKFSKSGAAFTKGIFLSIAPTWQATLGLKSILDQPWKSNDKSFDQRKHSINFPNASDILKSFKLNIVGDCCCGNYSISVYCQKFRHRCHLRYARRDGLIVREGLDEHIVLSFLIYIGNIRVVTG